MASRERSERAGTTQLYERIREAVGFGGTPETILQVLGRELLG